MTKLRHVLIKKAATVECKTNFGLAPSSPCSARLTSGIARFSDFSVYSFACKSRIMVLCTVVFEYTKQMPEISVARVTSGIRVVPYPFRILPPEFYFSSSGFRHTSSALMMRSPSFSAVSLPKCCKASWKGLCP